MALWAKYVFQLLLRARLDVLVVDCCCLLCGVDVSVDFVHVEQLPEGVRADCVR